MQENPFARAYRLLHETYQASEDPLNVRVSFVENPEDSKRRLGQDIIGRNSNRPVFNEVAIVYSTETDLPPSNRTLTIYARDGRPKTISKISPQCDPMAYTLFFPTGQLGYSISLKTVEGKNLTEKRPKSKEKA